jgi:NAD(P)-dependent dehydrogenase (short-subunit alcohol dehydrogenase family)
MPKPLENRVALATGAGSGIGRAIALGRLGESDEVAEAVLRLSFERASFMTGAYDAADAGCLAL